MVKIEDYMLPLSILVLGGIAIICYSLFDMNPILTGGITITILSIIEIISGRAVGTKKFKGLSSTLKIIKRKEEPSDFYLYILVHAFTGMFLVLMILLNNKNFL